MAKKANKELPEWAHTESLFDMKWVWDVPLKVVAARRLSIGDYLHNQKVGLFGIVTRNEGLEDDVVIGCWNTAGYSRSRTFWGNVLLLISERPNHHDLYKAIGRKRWL